MTVKGGSRPACAACRFQRRRCNFDCPLAPYFPATQPEIFQNVHSLYGVGHILKILTQLKDDDEKDEAMKSIIYESNIRQTHRVHGCYGVLLYLQQKLTESMQELRTVLFLLDAYKKKQNVSANDDMMINNYQPLAGGSNSTDHWFAAMINGVSDLGLHYNEVTPNQSHFDGFQQFYNVEQDDQDSADDYTDILGASFVDDQQQSFMGSKEAPDHFKLESSSDQDTAYITEPEELKVNEKLLHGAGSKTGL